MKFDFSGWATRNNLRCSDGRTIRQGAFHAQDGQTVPLVWNHRHNEPFNVLGHALLEDRSEGVYAYCTFNNTDAAQHAKEMVEHGDVSSLSIYANGLRQRGGDVLHGAIREVSLVLAGANPGAYIDAILAHGEESDEEAIIYTGEDIDLYHADKDDDEDEEEEDAESVEDEEDDDEEDDDTDNDEDEDEEEDDKVALSHAEDGDKTVQEVFDEFTDEQKQVVYALVGAAVEDAKGGDSEMKHNVFEGDGYEDQNYLSHDEMTTIIEDGKRFGSLKESFLAHADDYGIKDIETLFPEARNLNTPPDFIKREMGWVQKVMSGTHHTPFSRIKSMFANITEDEARARGYIKGHLKKEEVFTLLKRTTTPQTIYKKQKLDRDDIIDITDFDVVAWLKSEMRMMLDEEIARAVLIGDGRMTSDEDHISHEHVRPIWTDDDLYSVKVSVNVKSGDDEQARAKAVIRAAIKARKYYKGSGSPKFFTTEDVLTDMLLIEDGIGHLLYSDEAQLARTLRVSEIITVPVMEEQTRDDNGKTLELAGIIVNLNDYNIGADRGGAVSMFDDFDIDYNQQKYLIETRISGALIKPYSALVLEIDSSSGSGSTGGGSTTP